MILGLAASRLNTRLGLGEDKGDPRMLVLLLGLLVLRAVFIGGGGTTDCRFLGCVGGEGCSCRLVLLLLLLLLPLPLPPPRFGFHRQYEINEWAGLALSLSIRLPVPSWCVRDHKYQQAHAYPLGSCTLQTKLPVMPTAPFVHAYLRSVFIAYCETSTCQIQPAFLPETTE